ncbi:MAG: hypothetical protein HY736_23215 [Verrucomicrobia bacterium]|nr:hypothetical protein [Verrucomicrobiota bacterium]
MTDFFRRPLGWCLAAGAVVSLGFALRVAYHDRGYGHPDETITVEIVKYMRRSGDWDTNWAKADLDPSFRYDQYNFSSHLYANFFFYRLVKLLPGTAGWRSELEGFWVYRFFSVALASLAVGQVLRLGQRAGGRAAALGAGVLAATSLLLVQDAHYVRPEAFLTVLTLWAVALGWPDGRLRPGRVLGAGFLIGLLVACKVSMLLLAWLPLVPLVVAWRGGETNWRVLAALPLALGAGFAAGAPGAVAHPDVFLRGVQHLVTQYAGAHPPHSHVHGGPVAGMMARYFVATLGWPAVACFAVGLGGLLWRRRWAEMALLAGPVAVFAVFFATQTVFFERNLSPVLPLFFVVAALGALTIGAACAARVRLPGVGAGVAVLMFGWLLIRPLQLTGPLLWVEFSGRGAQRHDAFELALRARHPSAEWMETSLLNDGPLEQLAADFRAGRGPFLLRVTDFSDEWNARHLPLLAARFLARPLAEYPGTFPDLPVCTLQTYHSAHDRYFLVTGQRREAD